MNRSIAVLLPIAALAACGEAQEIPVTNTGNVVLNDSLANETFVNDEVVNTAANDAADMNAAVENGMTPEQAITANTPMPSNGM